MGRESGLKCCNSNETLLPDPVSDLPYFIFQRSALWC